MSAPFNFYLYIVVREPIFLGHPGKIAAQCAHAGTQHAEAFRRAMNQLDYDVAALVDRSTALEEDKDFINAYYEWSHSADKFGTTIVLGAKTSAEYEAAWNETANAPMCGQTVPFGKIHDPSYPATIGDTTVLVPMDTCFWLFAPARDSGYRYFQDLKWRSELKLLS